MAKLPANVSKALTDAAKALGKEGKKKPVKRKEESLIQKVGRKLRELYYGPETYLPKRRIKKLKRRARQTARTKATIKKGLKPAGLTEKEIARLRGKK